MKKVFITMAIIAVLSVLFAVPVTEQTARETAEFQLQLKEKTNHEIVDVHNLTDTEGNTVAYVHHLSPAGFIIVSVDTDLPPVIGYSFRNEFNTEDPENLGYLFVQDDMSKRLAAREFTNIEVLSSNNQLWDQYMARDESSFMTRERSIYPPEGYSSTGGWVDLLWDQGYPWNSYAPYDDVHGARSVTGCVATALSMILTYHEYIGSASFSNSDDYTSSYEGFVVTIDNDHETNDFPDFPTLTNYMIDVQEHFAGVEPLTDHVKAAVNFAAGVAVHMKYSSEASGAYVYYPGHNDTRDALLNKFDYDSAVGVYGTSPQIYDNFEEDSMNGRPGMLAILGGVEGHAIIYDGWNSGDDTFHLNFGWGGYNNGWYSLPYGMPGGYNTISNAITTIEGGGTLFDLFALVSTNDGTVPANADIEFRGTRLYEGNLDAGGSFSFDYMHEGTYQVSVTYENPAGGYYYKSETFDLDDSNDFLMMNLDSYTELTGTVSGVASPENAVVTFYNNEGEIVTTGLTGAGGAYTITGILPGTYTATASWGSSHYAAQEVEVTAMQQNFDFALTEYPETATLGYCGTAGDIFHLIPNTISCAIRLTSDELTGNEDKAFGSIEFKSPIPSANGQLWAQVWVEDNLVSEKEVTDFYYGENLLVELDNFVPVNPEFDYYVGFKVQSDNGDLAWFDTNPRVTDKGAWFRINSWSQVNPTFDHNFMIKTRLLSQTADEDETNITPVVTGLGKNYPNPFNPETNIVFSMAEAGEALVEIYNIKGQKIKTLANGHYDKGEYTLLWNGTDNSGASAASGIYFYKMKSGKYTSTKKMILMK